MINFYLHLNLERTPVSFGPGVFFIMRGIMEKEFKKHDELIQILDDRGIDFSGPKSKSEVLIYT